MRSKTSSDIFRVQPTLVFRLEEIQPKVLKVLLTLHMLILNVENPLRPTFSSSQVHQLHSPPTGRILLQHHRQ
jgi:hypothetical protein